MQIEAYSNFTIQDLTEKENHDWAAIELAFKSSPAVFENTLFKLHFKRNAAYNAAQKKAILKFLASGYVNTNDVRYFNEFLWFYNDTDNAGDLKELCYSNFKKNLDKDGKHSFPLATREEVKQFVTKHKRPDAITVNNKLNVGLVGFPVFFCNIIRELHKAGFNVQQVFIPFHPNKHIRRLLSIGLLVKIGSMLKKNSFKYDTLNYQPKDEAIGTHLAAKNFDIGFHKLNFIIRDNIFGNFKKGLINDHWGILPYLRGKSTIAYSVLFGFPVMPTMHLIARGIDMGDIIGFYECDYTGVTTINGVRDKIRSTLTGRVVDAIKRLSSNDFTFITNNAAMGLTFYEIHPWLYKHAEDTLKGA